MPPKNENHGKKRKEICLFTKFARISRNRSINLASSCPKITVHLRRLRYARVALSLFVDTWGQTSLVFSVGEVEIAGFRMVERHYFRNKVSSTLPFGDWFIVQRDKRNRVTLFCGVITSREKNTTQIPLSKHDKSIERKSFHGRQVKQFRVSDHSPLPRPPLLRSSREGLVPGTRCIDFSLRNECPDLLAPRIGAFRTYERLHRHVPPMLKAIYFPLQIKKLRRVKSACFGLSRGALKSGHPARVNLPLESYRSPPCDRGPDSNAARVRLFSVFVFRRGCKRTQ